MNATMPQAVTQLCIPIPDLPRGGMYTFLRYWRQWLDDHGVPWTDDLNADYDVLFVNSFMVPFETILAAKRARPGLRVVQRVDGSLRDYGRMDDSDAKQARVNMLADLTVFQSRYSRFSVKHKFRVIRGDGPIVYNAVDLRLFRPAEPCERRTGVRVLNTSYSTNPMKGTWQFGALAERHPDVTFVLCGHYPDLPDRPNLERVGHVAPERLAETMRGCDVYLHLAQNDPCPNAVIEALAGGLPVLHVDSGGVPELVGDCGLPVTLETFRSALGESLVRRDELAQRARARAEQRFAPDVVFPQYVRAIESCRRRAIPSFAVFFWMACLGYPVLDYSRREAARRLAKALVGRR
jgi:glycosyltransferase involved in cell wall biosynthesis